MKWHPLISIDKHGWILHSINSTKSSTSLPLFIFKDIGYSFKIFSPISLSGIYSCENLFAFRVRSSGSSHLFPSAFVMILNLSGDSFLLTVHYISKSDESVSDEEEGDGYVDLFLLSLFFSWFCFSRVLFRFSWVYHWAFVRICRLY